MENLGQCNSILSPSVRPPKQHVMSPYSTVSEVLRVSGSGFCLSVCTADNVVPGRGRRCDTAAEGGLEAANGAQSGAAVMPSYARVFINCHRGTAEARILSTT